MFILYSMIKFLVSTPILLTLNLGPGSIGLWGMGDDIPFFFTILVCIKLLIYFKIHQFYTVSFFFKVKYTTKLWLVLVYVILTNLLPIISSVPICSFKPTPTAISSLPELVWYLSSPLIQLWLRLPMDGADFVSSFSSNFLI